MKFSIKTALTLIVLVALVTALILSGTRSSELQQTADSYAQEGGVLQVDDPSCYYIKRLNCDIPKFVRVRIYCPPDCEKSLNFGAYFSESPVDWCAVAVKSIAEGQSIVTFGLTAQNGNRMISMADGAGNSMMTGAFDHPVFYPENVDTHFTPDPTESPHGPLETHSGDSENVPIIFLPTSANKGSTPLKEFPQGIVVWLGAEKDFDPNLARLVETGE